MKEDYFEIDRMSNSSLSNFKKSPRHYLYFKRNKIEPTPAMVLGSAFHAYVLENDSFDEKYIILPDDCPRRPSARQRNAAKPSPSTLNSIAFWDEFEKKANGKQQLSIDDKLLIEAMHESLMANEPARELLDAVKEVEVPLLWTDDISGVQMKGKLDGCCDDFTLDLKTTTNAFPDAFALDAFNSAYHRQAALYMDGRALNEEKRMKKGDFYFIAIEKEPPYGISVHKCARDFIEHGRQVYGRLLENYSYWIEMGSPDVDYEWHAPLGYFNLGLPKWIK